MGSSGLIWRTTDSTTITAVPSGTTSPLYGLHGSAANAFTVVGNNTPSGLRKL